MLDVQDPHAQHCCLNHGCRFNNNDQCSVYTGKTVQLSKCGETAACSEYRSLDVDEVDGNQYDH